MLTPAEWTVLGYILAVGLTLGAVLAIAVFFGAWAMASLTDLNDTEPDQGLDDLSQERVSGTFVQRELDAFRNGPSEAPAQPTVALHPSLRESGYYGSFEHQQRDAKVTRAMGGSDAA